MRRVVRNGTTVHVGPLRRKRPTAPFALALPVLLSLALGACHREPLSAAYYQACLDRGLEPHQARIRLMRRLSDVVFAMMRDKTAYDPEIHRLKQERNKTRKKGKSVAPASDDG